MSSTQELTQMYGYDTKNLVFKAPQEEKITTSTPPIKYLRVFIQTKLSDGSIGDLIIPTEVLFSFGVAESKPDNKSDKVTGYTIALSLFDRDGATEAQKRWFEAYENLIDAIKDHVVSIKKQIGLPRLEKRDLYKLTSSSFYWKEDEDGNRIPGKGPNLYPKLMVSNKDGVMQIKSGIFDARTGEKLDPLELIGKFGNVQAAIKIESIYISGDKVKLQVKLWEAEFEIKDSGRKRLLSGFAKKSQSSGVEEYDNYEEEPAVDRRSEVVDAVEEEEAGSIADDSDLDEVKPAPVAVAAPPAAAAGKRKPAVTKKK